MAYIESTATNFNDLLNKLKIDLVNNNWKNVLDATVSSSRELFFKNNSTNTSIGFKEVSSSPDYFNLYLSVVKNYSSSFDFFNQLGSIKQNPENTSEISNKMPVLSLVNTPMNYWAFIDDTRLILVVKCNTSYNSAYLGRFEQYGSPGQYPNAFFCGGNASSETMLNSSTSSENECFLFEKSNRGSLSGARFSKYDGNWQIIKNSSNNDGDIYPTRDLGLLNSYTTNLKYDLESIVLYSDISASGELKNIFWVAGRGLSAEAIITIDLIEYIVFPNIFRTTNKDFYCIKKV